ncbi:zinc finger protein 771-like [Amphibalanus amphitrite]|uniref:zinc finger protein 771-like n=1 Tax=Amphibalanus amphitrite TaxID=1232801 RepID=UPI001C90E0D2|nr:zinc finger protein 771-like [Amphibalanus amphitrite]
MTTAAQSHSTPPREGHQLEDETVATSASIMARSNDQCEVCGAPGIPCHPSLQLQAMYALMGTATLGTLLCVQCAKLAAQACDLHTQLQELDDQLRLVHISMLYCLMEQGGNDGLQRSKLHQTERPQVERGPYTVDLTCRLCDEQFSSTSALLTHLRVQHGADTPHGLQRATAPCGPCTVCRCGRTAAPTPESSQPLSRDTVVPDHSSARPDAAGSTAEGTVMACRSAADVEPANAEGSLACSACPQRFTSAAQRRRHQRQAHPLLLIHTCRHCGKRFPSPSKLRIHEDSHAGARPHACEVCGRRYLSAQKLHVHARSHTGERPFVCHMCGRTFASAAYLSQHELTHTGRRPHQCHVCGKQFTQRGTMTKHVRNVHGTLVGQRTDVGAAQGMSGVVTQGVTVMTNLSGAGAGCAQKLGT